LSEQNLYPMKIIPLTRPYVWGGNRLKPYFNTFIGENTPLAEAWLIGEDNLIGNGFLAGRSLLEVSKEYGKSLLGEDVAQKNDYHFPLLVKLLDCSQWLSLQVHPNDEQAIRLEGPDFRGKTEAWVVLEAVSESKLIAGLKPWISKQRIDERIRQGEIMDLVQFHTLQQNDVIFVGAGTVHALGPGILVYEVQQMSDLTYRMYDWDRPQTADRTLHIEKALQVIDPGIDVRVVHFRPAIESYSSLLVNCPQFVLEALGSSGEPITFNTHGKVFDVLTLTEGEARLNVKEYQLNLGKYESVLIPASCGEYQLAGEFKALKTHAQ
jgi:mannose-6-phosphate isomerase